MNIEQQPPETVRPDTPVEEAPTRRQNSCSFCKEVGHNILNCQCPERLLMERRIQEYISNIEGPLFYLSQIDIECRLFDEIHGYVFGESARFRLDRNDLRRLENIPLKNKLKMLCIILNIPISRTLNTMVQGIINKILNVREEIIANETDEHHLLRMDAYRRQVIDTLLTNGRTQLEMIDYDDIVHLHGKYKRYKTILAQLGQSSDPEIQNMFILTNLNIINLKEQIHNSINQYRLVYGENENFRLILKEVDGEFITIVKELVEDGEEWDDVECPICYDNIDSSSICMTNCFHKYCFQCLSKALKTNKERKCPCCRGPISQIVNKSYVVLNDEIPDVIILN